MHTKTKKKKKRKTLFFSKTLEKRFSEIIIIAQRFMLKIKLLHRQIEQPRELILCIVFVFWVENYSSQQQIEWK